MNLRTVEVVGSTEEDLGTEVKDRGDGLPVAP